MSGADVSARVTHTGYKWRLIPSIGTLFDWWGAGTTVPKVIPEFLWELSLGIYAAVRGFRRDAPILSPERR